MGKLGTSPFSPFGTEWDWLTFYWSLWTGSPMWDVDEITPMWHEVDNDDRASLCCPVPSAPYPPANCTKSNNGAGCPPLVTAEEIVGKLWANDGTFSVTDSVMNQVNLAYGSGSPMYIRFDDVGDDAKVAY